MCYHKNGIVLVCRKIIQIFLDQKVSDLLALFLDKLESISARSFCLTTCRTNLPTMRPKIESFIGHWYYTKFLFFDCIITIQEIADIILNSLSYCSWKSNSFVNNVYSTRAGFRERQHVCESCPVLLMYPKIHHGGFTV